MILEKWPDLSPAAKGSFLGFCALLSIGGGLALSGFVLSRSLNLSFDPIQDLFLWPRIALSDYSGAEVSKWVKLSGYAGLAPALFIVLAFLMNKPKQDLHGKARFAEDRDIKAAGLRSKNGLIAGFTGPLPSGTTANPWTSWAATLRKVELSRLRPPAT